MSTSAAASIPVTETYTGVQNLIYHFAHQFARKMGADFEELVSEGNLVFMQAYEAFRADSGVKFSTFLSTCLYRRFLDRSRQNWRYRTIYGGREGVHSGDGYGSDAAGELGRLIEPECNDDPTAGDMWLELSEDAAAIVQMVIDTPAEIRRAIDSRGGQPRNIRSVVKETLREMGWSMSRIRSAISEIQGALV